MTNTKWLWDVVVWFSLPVLGALGGVFVWRRLYRELPFFFVYVLSAFLLGTARLVAYRLGSSQTYLYVYWYSDFAGVMAALLAIYEVFLRRLFPSFYRVRLYRYLFPAAGFIISLLAFLTAVNAFSDRQAAFDSTSRSLDFLRTAVVGFFAALTLLMGRRFAGFEFWIASGFAFQAAVALANAAMRTRLPNTAATFDIAELLTFDVVCLVWLIVFWKPGKRSGLESTEELNRDMLHQARSWETLLKHWLTPGKGKR